MQSYEKVESSLMCRVSAPGPIADFSLVFWPLSTLRRGPEVDKERLAAVARQGLRKARCKGSALAMVEGTIRPTTVGEGKACIRIGV